MGEVSDPEQQYSLRWNDFHASILSSFRHLRDEEDFVDVTLACDGCSFTAHKVVLSACSPYFRRLLKANPCQHPIVILRDVREKDMESLLRFMYNGEVHIGQEQLSDFLKTAQMLQVRGLADVPTKDNQKIPPTSNSLPWSQSGELRDQFSEDPLSPPRKRSRNNEHRFSPSPASSATNNNNNGDPLMRETLLGQALEGGPTIHTGSTSHQNKGNSDSSLQAQSTGEDSNSSDTNSERGPPIGDLIRPKLEPNDYSSVDDNHHHHGNGNLGLDPTRTPPFPAAALLGLQNIPGLLPGPSGLHNNSQDANFGAEEESWMNHAIGMPWTQQLVDNGREAKIDEHGEEDRSDTEEKDKIEISGEDMTCHIDQRPHSSENVNSTAWTDHYNKSMVGEVQDQLVKCPHCARHCRGKHVLKSHIENVHVQKPLDQWEQCLFCNRKCKTRRYLTMHILRVHRIRQRRR